MGTLHIKHTQQFHHHNQGLSGVFYKQRYFHSGANQRTMEISKMLHLGPKMPGTFNNNINVVKCFLFGRYHVKMEHSKMSEM